MARKYSIGLVVLGLLLGTALFLWNPLDGSRFAPAITIMIKVGVVLSAALIRYLKPDKRLKSR